MDKEPGYDELLEEITCLNQQLAELAEKNRELIQLSNTDGLTGLYNHRFMMERCEHEFRRAKRYNRGFSCVLLDIDHFKAFNDTHGHQFGDHVLKKLGVLLRENSRSTDTCGRYGGEEFIILIPQPIEEAKEYILRLHGMIAAQEFCHGDIRARITVSIGLADFRGEMQSWHEIIARADQVLYLAKNCGRNMVRTWSGRGNKRAEIVNDHDINNLKKQFADIYQQVKESYVESANALLQAIDAKDHYTLRHSRNVAGYAIRLAEACGMKKQEIEIVKNAALLHDLGKIGIDECLLVKKETLSGCEYEILKRHPLIGVNILKNITLLAREIPLILHHHERFDGRGYPYGLQSHEIPLGAKILAIADAFDAMTTNRAFKAKMSPSAALRVIDSEKGQQFDPRLAEVFCGSMLSLHKDGTSLSPLMISTAERELRSDMRL
ncbi:MAG: diguanylate cyclase [Deltaproteobacteria bacterium]|nr:diguanylate cyclase [Deltaproteobacteria bacterium]